MSMSAKERVLCAVNLGTPDRVPVDFNANPPTLKRLMNDLDAATLRELLDILHVDIIDLRGVVDPVWCGPMEKETMLEDGVKQNFWGWKTKLMDTATGPEDSFCDFILAHASSIDELEKHRWPSVDWFDFSGFKDRLRPWNNFAVMATGASIFQHPSFLRGLDNLLVDMLISPEIADYLMDRYTDFYVEYYDRMFSCADGMIDIFRIADDIGMQDRLFINLDTFDRFFCAENQKTR